MLDSALEVCTWPPFSAIPHTFENHTERKVTTLVGFLAWISFVWIRPLPFKEIFGFTYLLEISLLLRMNSGLFPTKCLGDIAVPCRACISSVVVSFVWFLVLDNGRNNDATGTPVLEWCRLTCTVLLFSWNSKTCIGPYVCHRTSWKDSNACGGLVLHGYLSCYSNGRPTLDHVGNICTLLWLKLTLHSWASFGKGKIVLFFMHSSSNCSVGDQSVPHAWKNQNSNRLISPSILPSVARQAVCHKTVVLSHTKHRIDFQLVICACS